jgi:hypothetical protein
MSSVYFKFVLEPVWIASFSLPLLNGRWIILRFTAWCSLFDDQGFAIILWVLYIVSTVLNLVMYRFIFLSPPSCTGHAVFYCGDCVGVYWCCIMMSNILFRLSLICMFLLFYQFVKFIKVINLLFFYVHQIAFIGKFYHFHDFCYRSILLAFA